MYSLSTEQPRDLYDWLATAQFSDDFGLCVISRLPQRRFERVMSDVPHEHIWLTERGGEGSLEPVLERIHHELKRRIESGEGVIWFDAVEYLTTLSGFDPVLTFLRSVGDAISQSAWRFIAPLSPGAFEAQQLALLQRELTPWRPADWSEARAREAQLERVEEREEERTEVKAPPDDDPRVLPAPTPMNAQVPVLVEPRLVQLSTIPERMVNVHTLRERILAWRRMGVDTSDVEPALIYPISEMRLAYAAFEAQVRRAVELDKLTDRVESLGHLADTAKARFRIRQLTGLDEVERELATLLELDKEQRVPEDAALT